MAVCGQCGRRETPALAALLELARLAQRVGRIARHSPSLPMTALLDLTRSAEEYVQKAQIGVAPKP
jgi:hypothetical protein